MRTLRFPSLLLAAAALVQSACTPPPPVTADAKQAPSPQAAAPQPAPAATQTVLKAVLFPYIPDSVGDSYKSLIQKLESGFESITPGVDLQITINANIDLYSYQPNGVLSRLLGDGPEAVQVVEVDTLLLGNLKASGWIQPVGIPNPNDLPTAWQAASIDGVAYGAPTYLCTNVIYSGSPTVTTAANGTNLIALLTAIKPGVTPLVGNYSGSWTLPSTYVDAWADTNGTAGMASAYNLPLDQRTMSFFPTVVNSCASSATTNPCLDGAYSSGTQAETLFATGKANGFIGYTERLFYIRQANPALPLPTVISDPIGGGTHPSMFVDALVFNPNCTGTCLSAAKAFAGYMSSVAVRNLIAFSQDGPPGTLPRYLLQANESFYSSEPAASDPMYKAYAPIVKAAAPFPNTGFPDSRKALQQALIAALSSPSAPKSATPAATPAKK